MDQIATLIREKFADDLDFQFTLFKSVQDGLAQRGAKLPASLREWAAGLTEKLLSPANETNATWISIPLADAPTASPWFLQKRTSADGNEAIFSVQPAAGRRIAHRHFAFTCVCDSGEAQFLSRRPRRFSRQTGGQKELHPAR